MERQSPDVEAARVQHPALGVHHGGHQRPFTPQEPSGHRADVAEALDDHPRAAKLESRLADRLGEDVDEPAAGGVAPARRAADQNRLPGHDAGHRAALGHGVRVHDPRHGLLVRAHVGSPGTSRSGPITSMISAV